MYGIILVYYILPMYLDAWSDSHLTNYGVPVRIVNGEALFNIFRSSQAYYFRSSYTGCASTYTHIYPAGYTTYTIIIHMGSTRT